MEHFQWKNEQEIEEYLKDHKNDLADELADVLNTLLMICYDLDIDIIEASEKKLIKNNLKYPVEKAKGKHTKYSKL